MTRRRTAEYDDVIAAMARQGYALVEIADRVGSVAGAVSVRLNALRRRGLNLPRFRPGTWPPLTEGEVAALGRIAERRGVDVRVLARRIMVAVIRNDLVDAVLDDQAPEPDGAGPARGRPRVR